MEEKANICSKSNGMSSGPGSNGSLNSSSKRRNSQESFPAPTGQTTVSGSHQTLAEILSSEDEDITGSYQQPLPPEQNRPPPRSRSPVVRPKAKTEPDPHATDSIFGRFVDPDLEAAYLIAISTRLRWVTFVGGVNVINYLRFSGPFYENPLLPGGWILWFGLLYSWLALTIGIIVTYHVRIVMGKCGIDSQNSEGEKERRMRNESSKAGGSDPTNNNSNDASRSSSKTLQQQSPVSEAVAREAEKWMMVICCLGVGFCMLEAMLEHACHDPNMAVSDHYHFCRFPQYAFPTVVSVVPMIILNMRGFLGVVFITFITVMTIFCILTFGAEPSFRVLSYINLAKFTLFQMGFAFGIVVVDKVRRVRFLTMRRLVVQEREAEERKLQVNQTLSTLVPRETLEKVLALEPAIDSNTQCCIGVCNIYDYAQWSTTLQPRTGVEIIDILFSSIDDLLVFKYPQIHKVLMTGDLFIFSLGLKGEEGGSGGGGNNNNSDPHQQSSSSLMMDSISNLSVDDGAGNNSAYHKATAGGRKKDPVTDTSTMVKASLQQIRGVKVLSKHNLQVCVGLSTGPCVGAMFGRQYLRYNLLGPALDTAMTLSHASAPMNLCVCERTKNLLQEPAGLQSNRVETSIGPAWIISEEGKRNNFERLLLEQQGRQEKKSDAVAVNPLLTPVPPSVAAAHIPRVLTDTRVTPSPDPPPVLPDGPQQNDQQQEESEEEGVGVDLMEGLMDQEAPMQAQQPPHAQPSQASQKKAQRDQASPRSGRSAKRQSGQIVGGGAGGGSIHGIPEGSQGGRSMNIDALFSEEEHHLELQDQFIQATARLKEEENSTAGRASGRSQSGAPGEAPQAVLRQQQFSQTKAGLEPRCGNGCLGWIVMDFTSPELEEEFYHYCVDTAGPSVAVDLVLSFLVGVMPIWYYAHQELATLMGVVLALVSILLSLLRSMVWYAGSRQGRDSLVRAIGAELVVFPTTILQVGCMLLQEVMHDPIARRYGGGYNHLFYITVFIMVFGGHCITLRWKVLCTPFVLLIVLLPSYFWVPLAFSLEITASFIPLLIMTFVPHYAAESDRRNDFKNKVLTQRLAAMAQTHMEALRQLLHMVMPPFVVDEALTKLQNPEQGCVVKSVPDVMVLCCRFDVKGGSRSQAVGTALDLFLACENALKGQRSVVIVSAVGNQLCLAGPMVKNAVDPFVLGASRVQMALGRNQDLQGISGLQSAKTLLRVIEVLRGKFGSALTAILATGGGFASVIGGAHPTFDITGGVKRQALTLLEEAPQGYCGATSKFVYLMNLFTEDENRHNALAAGHSSGSVTYITDITMQNHSAAGAGDTTTTTTTTTTAAGGGTGSQSKSSLLDGRASKTSSIGNLHLGEETRWRVRGLGHVAMVPLASVSESSKLLGEKKKLRGDFLKA